MDSWNSIHTNLFSQMKTRKCYVNVTFNYISYHPLVNQIIFLLYVTVNTS